MREHSVNSMNNFIAGWYADDTTFCDDIIRYFNTPSCNKWDGTLYHSNGDLHVDRTIKHSVETTLNENQQLHQTYIGHLQQVIGEYIEKYPMSGHYSRFTNTEITKVQYYPPKGGFFQWHTERATSHKPVCDRHLVYLTYLNDLDDGETEFYHQQLKIKPEKGLTLIWGSDWTFTHRGISSVSDKYIVTGWFNFIE